MSFLPLRWTDRFFGLLLDEGLWVGGYANPSKEIRLSVNNGVHFTLEHGNEYASAAVVLREPVVGDFDARVRFTVANPQLATTFELACITIDPPGEAQLDQSKADTFTRSLVYDVHGAPPYVSSEFDENQGSALAGTEARRSPCKRMGRTPIRTTASTAMDAISAEPRPPAPADGCGW